MRRRIFYGGVRKQLSLLCNASMNVINQYVVEVWAMKETYTIRGPHTCKPLRNHVLWVYEVFYGTVNRCAHMFYGSSMSSTAP